MNKEIKEKLDQLKVHDGAFVFNEVLSIIKIDIKDFESKGGKVELRPYGVMKFRYVNKEDVYKYLGGQMEEKTADPEVKSKAPKAKNKK